MTFRVEIARRAAREIEEQYAWFAKRSRVSADRWRDCLLAAVDSLEEQPQCCPEASEAEWYGPTLRQLLHGKCRCIHRILFEIRGDGVVVLGVRHGAGELLGPEDF
jgi:plasmid stabilization system protein ParE